MHTSSGEDVYCSVISFLNGSPLGELEGESLLKGMQELGRITAKLHIQSISRDKTIPIKRFSWDINNFSVITVMEYGEAGEIIKV